MKKIISLLLVSVMILVILPVAVSAEVWNGTSSSAFSGEGTQVSPYAISNGAELRYLAEQVNAGNNYAGKYFVQTADIDLGNKEWTPIGCTDKPFSGVYDGANHEISGLSITATSEHAALFGYVDVRDSKECGIANLTVSGIITTTNTSKAAAGLVAEMGKDNVERTARLYLLNIVTNVDVAVTAKTTEPRIGGIAGFCHYAVIENCTNNGSIYFIEQATKDSRIGGIVSQGNLLEICNCTNNGKITVEVGSKTPNVGGIIAMPINRETAGNRNVTLFACVNNGDIDVTTTTVYPYVSGISGPGYSYVGKPLNLHIIGCVNTGEITGTIKNSTTAYPYVGGIFSYLKYQYVRIEDCVNTGKINSIGGKEQRNAGIISVMNYSVDGKADSTSYVKKCISSSNVYYYSINRVIKCTENADDDTIREALLKIEEDRRPTLITSIAGFSLTNTEYVTDTIPKPEGSAPLPPSTEVGDSSYVIVILLVISLAGALTFKKLRVR